MRFIWDVFGMSLSGKKFSTHIWNKNKPSTTHPREYMGYIWEYINIWEKVFMNGPKKIFWRLSSTNFTWSILEYFVPNICGNKTVRVDLYWKPCQTLNLELFPKQMTALSKLTIFVKGFIIDDWQGLKCSSHLHDPFFVKQTEDIVKLMKIQLKIMQWSNFTSNLLYANLKIHRKIRNLEEL